MENPEEVEIPIIVEVDLTDGWGGERWDVKAVIDERSKSSLGDIGIYEFDAYSDFPSKLEKAVLDVLLEYEDFAPDKFYTLSVSVRDGGTEIGSATTHFGGWQIKARE